VTGGRYGAHRLGVAPAAQQHRGNSLARFRHRCSRERRISWR
jgi:hypothetical protein